MVRGEELEAPLNTCGGVEYEEDVYHVIGAEERGLRVLDVLCPLVKIRRATLVDEVLEFGFLFGGELMSARATFIAKSFEKELHANGGAILGFWTFRRILPEKFREVFIWFDVPMFMVILYTLLLLVRIFV